MEGMKKKKRYHIGNAFFSSDRDPELERVRTFHEQYPMS